MKLQVRKTTPLTAADYEVVQVFATTGTAEHDALERVSPVPLREGSEGSVLRALTLLGVRYVREREEDLADLAAGYDELAAERRRDPGVAPPLRAGMTRRARMTSAQM